MARELVSVSAIYYKAGEFPHAPDGSEDRAWLSEDGSDVWWYPGAEQAHGRAYSFDLVPPMDADERLTVDAVRFEFSVPASSAHEFWDCPIGIIADEILNSGLRETFGGHIDTIKAACDLVRGDSEYRFVEALIVYECEAGKDPDTWLGPGDYWTRYEPIGLLDLSKAEIQRLPE